MRRRGLILVSVVITMVASGCSGTTSVVTSGTTWSAPVRVGSNGSSSPPSSLYGVSCPNAASCIAVDENGSALFWHGRKWWSGPQPVGAGGTLSSISCPSTTFCVAVSVSGSAVIYDGHAWSSPLPLGPAATYKVSCPTVTFCAAVGANGTAGAASTLATFDGQSWSTQQTSPGGLKDRLLDVSCATRKFCVAVNLDGKTLVFDGQRWSNVAVDGPPGMISVSCASSTFCLAITDSGASAVFDGTSWSPPADIPAFASAFAYSVSCGSTTRCTAFGLSGMAVTWQQGRWSTPVRVFPGAFSATLAVSCVAPDTCMAVNSKGEAASN
jgi:hypothetical protein